MRGLRRTCTCPLACLLLLIAQLDVAHTFTAVIKGKRAPCSNEGEPVRLPDATLEHDWSTCFSCFCKNGFVECRSVIEDCEPTDVCAVVMPRKGCCAKCKGCWYNGTERPSHTEWTEENRLLRCEAGVVTITQPECYVPCARSKHQSRTRYNCPVCDECIINGQHVMENRDVRFPDELCLSCSCVLGALSCTKRACPVLPCSTLQQYTPPGECCSRCMHSAPDRILPVSGPILWKPCIIGKEYFDHHNHFLLDSCTHCTCMNGTAVCVRRTCPVLTCGARALPPPPGECCPQCPQVYEVKVACVMGLNTYHDGETWQLDACMSCECRGGEPRCAIERCLAQSCRPDQMLRQMPGQCCQKCVDIDGTCTMFGDSHFKTFDGRFYSFQGLCKYQLVSDYTNGSFSIRLLYNVKNTSATRTATLQIGTTKINLGKMMRIKVNGLRVSLPHHVSGVADITRSNGSVLLIANIGVQILWDGNDFLEVTVSSVYKGKLCGLCGNYNLVARDDMRTRDGRFLHDTRQFGASWRVGGARACTRRLKQPVASALYSHPKVAKVRRLCRGFQRHDTFAECIAKVNPHNYQKACKADALRCAGTRCHCAAYRAYAHECARAGAAARDWAQAVWCAGAAPAWLVQCRGRVRPALRPQLLNPAANAHRNAARVRLPPPTLH